MEVIISFVGQISVFRIFHPQNVPKFKNCWTGQIEFSDARSDETTFETEFRNFYILSVESSIFDFYAILWLCKTFSCCFRLIPKLNHCIGNRLKGMGNLGARPGDPRKQAFYRPFSLKMNFLHQDHIGSRRSIHHWKGLVKTRLLVYISLGNFEKRPPY